MAPSHFDFDSLEKAKQCINILRNFYNYILHHNVCPEYTKDVLAARQVCDLADEEVHKAYKAAHPSEHNMCLPGDFSLACSCLFGVKGTQGNADWSSGFESRIYRSSLTDLEARLAFSLGHAAYGDAAFFSPDKHENKKQLMLQDITDVEEDIGLEVTGIEFANAETKKLYNGIKNSPFKSLGKLRCKSWTPPDFAEWDLPEGAAELTPSMKAYEFWIEDEILENCFVGMKIEGTVHTLTSGLQFFDNITAVWCSFYTFMDNELVRKWKDPRLFTREEYLARQLKDGDQEEEGPELDEID